MASRSTEVDGSATRKDTGRAPRTVKRKAEVTAGTKATGKASSTGKTATSKAAKAKKAPVKKAATGKKAAARKKHAAARSKVAPVNGRARSAAGRPPRLSRKMVLEKAMQLLEEGPVEDFTMARVAASLDTVSMALYNYFPSRKALLAAVADHICMRFKMPPRKRHQTWQDTLWQWLWTFKRLSDEYPFVLKVMGVDGKSSPGWLRVTLTVSRTLHEIGFREHKLAVHAWMFCSNAIALVFNEREGSIFRSPISLSDIDELEPDEQDFLIMLRRYHSDIASEEVLELGFQGIIANVERELATMEAAR
ncbi:MAG TPA: hypothetical protein DD459_13115 [Halieaceae bacterium]|nr:hypothetical protein [Halieaceae bacterium]